MKRIYWLGIALITGGGAHAAEPLKFETTILGNREQPRVTFDIPWREFALENSETVTPGYDVNQLNVLDRESFRRTLDYAQWTKDAPAPQR